MDRPKNVNAKAIGSPQCDELAGDTIMLVRRKIDPESYIFSALNSPQ